MKVCKVKDCDGKTVAKGYCNKHRQQLKIYGKILERTIRTPNEIICKGEVCEIVLYNNKHKEVARAIIDREDEHKIINRKWNLGKKGYVRSSRPYMLLMHHCIVSKPKKGLDVDHCDNNRLNNKKGNLRIATRGQNQVNKKVPQKGISKLANGYGWQAQIGFEGENIYLGYSKTKFGAMKIRREAELKYYGDFAPVRN